MKFLSIFTAFVLNSSSPMSFEQEIDTIVNQAIEEFHVPGIGLVIVNKGTPLFCKGYGMRDIRE